jgi:hypothetical protein
MNVYQKLISARLKLQNTELKKSGNNKFAGYKYFELGDFLPVVQTIFAEHDLIGVVSFGTTEATLTITDMDKPEDKIVITSPMSTAALKGCHEVQNLGAVQTYLRRYLWVTAMEIVEHDALDASEPLKPEGKKLVSNAPASAAWEDMPSAKAPAKKSLPEGNGGNWNIKITEDHDGQGWAAAAKAGAEIALELASNAGDVLEIFKTNRTIFDQLQTADKAMHAELMEKFKEAKERLK